MPVDVDVQQDGKLISATLSGKLTVDDYVRFSPLVDDAVSRHGKIRALIKMQDFHGWGVAALWEDIKFDLRHFRDIERLAMVGDKAWEKGMAAFCKPFTSAKIRYFDMSDEAAAETWIKEEG